MLTMLGSRRRSEGDGVLRGSTWRTSWTAPCMVHAQGFLATFMGEFTPCIFCLPCYNRQAVYTSEGKPST